MERTVNLPPEFAAAFQRARELHARGSLQEAERAYKELAAAGEHREPVLRAMVELYMGSGRTGDAIAGLVDLTREVPDRLYYFALLANLLDRQGQTAAAIDHYRRLLERQPELADAHYNLALLYKKEKRYREAERAYEQAIRLGIEKPEEVYSNMGVLYAGMQQPDKAAAMHERALEIDAAYVPALFNRGGLYEEAGDRESATAMYRRILDKEPGHSGALARLVHSRRITDAGDPVLQSVDAAIEHAGSDPVSREELLFARGKALDDLGRYREAFDAFTAANELGRARTPAYDRAAAEQAFGQLIDTLDGDWIDRHASSSADSPIFVCGMFRSGSTLLEQILSAHPSVTAGGELDFLPWLVSRRLSPFPQRALEASTGELRGLADSYLAHLRELFPDAAHVTDKRPDNFLYLGLLKAAFPRARFVYTQRSAADVCLSIWFQQLGLVSYATGLEDTAHYYGQHERLVRHWHQCFGENLFTVDYDELVRSPEAVLRPLLDFLGLEWSDRCLDFRDSASPARTASLWQVREALHTRSSGRWRHYAPFIEHLDGPWRTA